MDYIFYILLTSITTFSLEKMDANYNSYGSVSLKPLALSMYSADFHIEGIDTSASDVAKSTTDRNSVGYVGYGNKLYIGRWWIAQDISTSLKRVKITQTTQGEFGYDSTSDISFSEDIRFSTRVGYAFWRKPESHHSISNLSIPESNEEVPLSYAKGAGSKGFAHYFTTHYTVEPYISLDIVNYYFNTVSNAGSNYITEKGFALGLGVDIENVTMPWMVFVEAKYFNENFLTNSSGDYTKPVKLSHLGLEVGFRYKLQDAFRKINDLTFKGVKDVYKEDSLEDIDTSKGNLEHAKDILDKAASKNMERYDAPPPA